MAKTNTERQQKRRARLIEIGFVNAYGQHHKSDTQKVQNFLAELNKQHPEFYLHKNNRDE